MGRPSCGLYLGWDPPEVDPGTRILVQVIYWVGGHLRKPGQLAEWGRETGDITGQASAVAKWVIHPLGTLEAGLNRGVLGRVGTDYQVPQV